MEKMGILDLEQNYLISSYIKDQKFYQFSQIMKYKCEWNGIEFIQAEKYYPSSKTCSSCGNIKHNLRVSNRVYKCDCCGLEIDRDYNAAINLMRYVPQVGR